MFQNSHFVLRAAKYRAQDLRRRAADDAVADAITTERKRAAREAALARLRAAAAAREERAVFTWQSQRERPLVRGLRSAR